MKISLKDALAEIEWLEEKIRMLKKENAALQDKAKKLIDPNKLLEIMIDEEFSQAEIDSILEIIERMRAKEE